MIKVSTDIEDFITIDQRYLKNISTENVILERIVNEIMCSEEVQRKLKDYILKEAGEKWFRKIDNKFVWKGVIDR